MVDYKTQLGANDGLFSGINIVPFTDIVLVLLVIFMIAAPGLLRSGLGVQLPGAKNRDPQLSEPIHLILDKQGKTFLEGNPVTIIQLAARMQELVKKRPDLGVVLNADRGVRHGQVITILDVLRSARISRIYVGTRKE